MFKIKDIKWIYSCIYFVYKAPRQYLKGFSFKGSFFFQKYCYPSPNSWPDKILPKFIDGMTSSVPLSVFVPVKTWSPHHKSSTRNVCYCKNNVLRINARKYTRLYSAWFPPCHWQNYNDENAKHRLNVFSPRRLANRQDETRKNQYLVICSFSSLCKAQTTWQKTATIYGKMT